MPLWLIQVVVGVVLTVASSLIQAATKPKEQPAAQIADTPTGFRGSAVTGGDVPMSFVLGTLGLAGKLEYQNTYGDVDGTPNAYLVGVYSLSDLPIAACTGIFVNGTAVTKSATGHTTQGYPVSEYGNKLWWEFFDGSQTTANSFLTGAFGSDADRPWTSSMIGRGIAYMTMTALFDRNIWNGFPTFMFEVRGIPLYDVRKDSDAGGSGSHRLDTPSTWEFSDNPIVAVYNILCGIKYAGSWVWGMQDAVDQSRLPYATWAAAMDACDESVDLAGGGTEKRFRIGREVSFSETPADVIDELLVACNGRISEAAGVYTVVVGDPGSAAGSFTDDDALITDTQTLDPFPALDQIVNGATATYLEPSQAWESKEAAPYYRSDLETEDDGRRQLVGLTLNSVFSGTQVQRLLKSKVEDSRRFYRHVLSLPPVFGVYRPLDVLSYTSTRNGYSGKDFLATAYTEAPNGNIVFGLQEVDPTDHDWSTADQQTITFAPVTKIIPPPQPMTGFAVSPYTFPSASGTPRRAGMLLEYTGELPDVRAVAYQVREDFGSGNTVAVGEITYDKDEEDPAQPIGGLWTLPNTDYEVRAKFLPFSGRETEWSDWLAVTTPDVGIEPEDLGASLQEFNRWIGLRTRDLDELMQLATSIAADQDAGNYQDKLYVLNKIVKTSGDLQAAYTQAILVALGADGSALADAIEAVDAAAGQVSAGFLSRFTAFASPGGGWARYGIQVRADVGIDFSASASFYLETKTDGTSRIVMKASETNIVDDSDNVLALFETGGAFFDKARIHDLTADNIDVDDIFAQTATVAGVLTVGAHITIDGPNGRIVVTD